MGALAGGASLAAAAIVALDPVLVAQGRSVMTETLAAFLTAATLWRRCRGPGRRGAALGGLAFGLGALCRPERLPAARADDARGLVAIAGPGAARTARAALILVAVTVATLAPWAMRNALVLGEPVWTTTHGGYTLYLANNPVYYDEVVNGPPGAVWTGHNQWLWWDSVNRSTRGPDASPRPIARCGPRPFGSSPADRAISSGRRWRGSAGSGDSRRPRRSIRAGSGSPTAPGRRRSGSRWLLGLTARGLWSWPRIAAPPR